MRHMLPALGPTAADEINDQSNIEQWVETLRRLKGHYTPKPIGPKTFAGRVTPRMICGLDAVEISANGLMRADRTPRDVRLDHYDHYHVLFQTAGNPTTVVQHDTVSELGIGNFAIVQSALPVTYAPRQTGGGRWLSVVLPRAELISHLGFEPRLSPIRQNAPLKRLLFDLASSISDPDASADRNTAWMKLAFYDLIGALYAVADQERTTAHNAKMFDRVCALVRDRFTDPDLSAHEIAGEASISLRYLQKLFTLRGSTFGYFLAGLRLDHAANLIRRRALTKSDQPLSSIAHACGYSDYTHFARAYRRRFGHSPRDTRFDAI